jgi:hypothetical protein
MKLVATLAATALFAGAANADIVNVTVEGVVNFNTIGEGELGTVSSGDVATMSFSVDSDMFTEGIPGDLRSYDIDAGSFSLDFDSGASVGLMGAPTSYFTLVDGFPVSDGFFVSTSLTSPGGAPLSEDPYNINLDLGYVGETLSSLNILDAVGVYEFDGLTRFGFNIWAIAPENVRLDMDFVSMTIATPAPSAALLLPLGLLTGRRRRR